MDTVVGDGATMDKLGRDLIILLPFSIVGQFWQIYNSYVMGKKYIYHGHQEWQVAVVGTLFAIIGIGNMITTVGIYFRKKQKNFIQS